jgi:hypothetical protein
MYHITIRTSQGRPQHKEETKMTNVRESALALYDGGWRAEDEAELRAEYNLTDDEAAELARELASIAE